MRVIGIIPAHLNSKRFPNKVLYDIDGKPLIQHVWETAKKAKNLDEVYIATGDRPIMMFCNDFGAKVIETKKLHKNGTSRLSEAIDYVDCDIAINIQADQLIIPVDLIENMVEKVKEENFHIITGFRPIFDKKEYYDKNVVKGINTIGIAHNFCRKINEKYKDLYKVHIGIYAYPRITLENYKLLVGSNLEEKYRLEQYRFLESGIIFKGINTKEFTLSIDTKEDIKKYEDYKTKKL